MTWWLENKNRLISVGSFDWDNVVRREVSRLWPWYVTFYTFVLVWTYMIIWLILTFVVLGFKLYDSLNVGEFFCPYFSYRRFAVYHTQHVGELLTQRKSRRASGPVFDYDARNKTLTEKTAQNRRCRIQSVSVEVWWGDKACREGQCSDQLWFPRFFANRWTFQC